MKPKCPKCGKEGTPYYNLRNELQGYDCVPCNLTDLENIERWKYTTVDVSDSQLTKETIDKAFDDGFGNLISAYDHKISMTVVQNNKHTYEYITIPNLQDTEISIESILLNLDTGYLYAGDLMSRKVFCCNDFRRDLRTIYRRDLHRKDMSRFVMRIDVGLADLFLNTNERLILVKEL